MLEFKLPAIGEGVVEGEIVRWLKKPGEPVAANEALVEVMTDKATVEIPSPKDAVLQEIKADEGEIAAVGEVIALLGEPGASSARRPDGQTASASTTSPAQASAAQAPAAAAPVPAASAATVPSTSHGNGRVMATPAARALAREHGIDLTTVRGEAGRITREHVLAAQAHDERPTAVATGPTVAPKPPPSTMPTQTGLRPPTPAAQPDGAHPADEIVPFRGMRRRIAEGMTKSFFTAVHYTYVEQVEVTKLVEVRKQAKAAAAAEGVNLTYLPFIVKAVIRGLKKFPIVNSELDEQGGRIIVKKRYDIGIATATEQGLMVPVVHGADRLSILQIAAEIDRVSQAARAGKASLHELTGSTFTITSLGTIGGVLATPILNYPEVGVLGVHAIRKVPLVDDDDQIRIGHVMNLSVSLDHRVVDGFEGASFLQEVKRYLEDPTLLLLAGI